jgi:glutamyl-tRNA reductase
MSQHLIETAMRPRRHRPLFVIDIAVPRDVDPAAGNLEQVFLYNIDDLQAVVAENVSKRTSEIEEAETIIAREVDRFRGWLRSRGAIPTVVALRQHCEAIRRAELQRLEPKLLAGLSPEARNAVEQVTRLMMEKLLIGPTEHLKSLSDGETIANYTEVLNRLFALSQTGQGDLESQDGPTSSLVTTDAGASDGRPARSKTSSSS